MRLELKALEGNEKLRLPRLDVLNKIIFKHERFATAKEFHEEVRAA